MKKLIIATLLGLPLLASAQNLLVNGSFENGLTGWTTAQTAGTIYPIAPLAYNSQPGAFGEAVPADNFAPSLSPDATGSFGVYFVDDQTTQVLSQQFTVSEAGRFNVGFSLYVPANGAANPGAATLQVSFAEGLNTETVSVQVLPVASWTGAATDFQIPAGTHTIAFTFRTQGGFSADAVVDRVYITAVPEPGASAMFLAGLGVISLIAARRRRD